jgi:hypothetical protein
MTWTKATYLSRTREWMDATGSDRWSDAFLYALLGLKFREEWEGVLDAAPTYRFAQRSVTTDANGQFALSALASGSGDTAQTAYKLITVTDGTVLYRETDYARVPLATSGTYNGLEFDRSYYLIGDTVQVLPTAAGLGLTVAVNWVPTPIDQLSGDAVTADFVDGYENLVALLAAADALAKGGTETGATGDLRALAQTYRQGLYASVQRRTTTPMFLGFSDSSIAWGG